MKDERKSIRPHADEEGHKLELPGRTLRICITLASLYPLDTAHRTRRVGPRGAHSRVRSGKPSHEQESQSCSHGCAVPESFLTSQQDADLESRENEAVER